MQLSRRSAVRQTWAAKRAGEDARPAAIQAFGLKRGEFRHAEAEGRTIRSPDGIPGKRSGTGGNPGRLSPDCAALRAAPSGLQGLRPETRRLPQRVTVGHGGTERPATRESCTRFYALAGASPSCGVAGPSR